MSGTKEPAQTQSKLRNKIIEDNASRRKKTKSYSKKNHMKIHLAQFHFTIDESNKTTISYPVVVERLTNIGVPETDIGIHKREKYRKYR